ncbi:UDP-glucose:undecaprenyl-phosphate glucose-1-phosphate transferase [Novipirellula aureliae]|uniref:UDP-glucose:undecaprenyl-phosphate glucose-1-phosphate transferase n=1 Tax=Novipirellula aureliae TaxID=2527966 RepID=A0A5C6E3S5_9BACT|nr:sugar transferase [Novipirellula aureliae]TWU44323.1 UDP-glucose:undecaprenyl-phosphate glucose-1-phosphate transferase [Novipirellula aureliae]
MTSLPSIILDSESVGGSDAFLELPASRQPFFARKYALERIVGAIALVLFSPLILILWAVVKLTSPGPGFYKQSRMGLNGQTFEMVKLRSMVFDAEKPGKAVWCVRGDSRITPLGRWLRKLHLDELPQLFNVARGEMSLVGPRPERPSICDTLADEIDNYYRRLTVKPGVTGLAQINLPPDETIEDVKRKQVLDLLYICETNTWMELRILAATGLRMVGIKGETVMRWMRLCRRDVLVDHGLISASPLPRWRPRPFAKRRRRRADLVAVSTVGSDASESESYIDDSTPVRRAPGRRPR